MKHLPKRTAISFKWLALAAFCCAVAAGAWLDARMKSADSWGYVPVAAQIQIAVGDIPGVWRKWRLTPTAQAMDVHLSRQLHDLALSVRQSTGIRPTPLRVSAWLGQRVLVGASFAEGDAPEWGLCIHPGLLLRMGHSLKSFLGATPNGDIFQFYDWHYAWRDAFIIASPTRDYVVEALQNAAPFEISGDKNADVLFQWQGDHAGSIALYADNDLSFEAQWRGALPVLPRAQKSDTAFDADPDSILSVLGGAPAPYLQYLGAPERAWHEPMLKPALALAAPWWAAWVRTDAFSKMDVDSFRFSLSGVDFSSQLPVPEWVLSVHTPVAQPQHPLLEAINCAVPMPFAWNEDQGVLLPLAGPQWTLALQGKNNVWHCAGQESVMNRFLSKNIEKSSVEQASRQDFQLWINWKSLGKSAGELANYAANNELIAWNALELPEHISPWLDFLKTCGHFDFSATTEKDCVIATGHLNRRGVTP